MHVHLDSHTLTITCQCRYHCMPISENNKLFILHVIRLQSSHYLKEAQFSFEFHSFAIQDVLLRLKMYFLLNNDMAKFSIHPKFCTWLSTQLIHGSHSDHMQVSSSFTFFFPFRPIVIAIYCCWQYVM